MPRSPAESFRTWALRTPDEAITSHPQPFVQATNEPEDLFIDWGDQETYSLKLRRGGCAA